MFFCTQHLYIATSNLVPRRGPSGINNEVSMGDEASRPVRRRSSVRSHTHSFFPHFCGGKTEPHGGVH